MVTALVAGGIGIASSFFSHKSAKRAQKKQDKIAQDQLDLTKEQYQRGLQDQQRWKEMYGGVERNLLNYVKNMSASSVYANSEASMRLAFENSRNKAESHLADRGFDVASGVHSSMFADLADREARAEVELRQFSEDKVAQTQQSLLSGNPMPNNPSVQGQIGAMNTQMQLAGQKGQTQQDEWGAIAGIAGKATGMFYNKYAKKNQLPTYKMDTTNGYNTD